jgi:hypothetical protein
MIQPSTPAAEEQPARWRPERFDLGCAALIAACPAGWLWLDLRPRLPGAWPAVVAVAVFAAALGLVLALWAAAARRRAAG